MSNYTATDIVLILTALFAGISGIIAAIKGHRKLDKIQENTNGAASMAASAAETAAQIIAELQTRVVNLTEQIRVLQERRITQTRSIIPPKIDALSQQLTDHDNWEKEERKVSNEKLDENTELTKFIKEFIKDYLARARGG